MNNKLLLFDIDGTLLSGRGIPRKIFIEMIRKRFPRFTVAENLQFSGLTDPAIVQKILEINGYDGDINYILIDDILREFASKLMQEINDRNPPKILAGVVELLDRCEDIPFCYLGLVTGNIMSGARIKLKAGGLYRYFPVGAFGSDYSDRNLLPPIAIRRARQYYGVPFKKNDIWIIGDSIYDICCARVNGLKCLAVHSGITERSVLQKERPDYLLQDLQNTDKILKILGF